MIYRMKKKTLFLISIVLATFLGGIGAYARSNFSRNESSLITRAYADNAGGACGSGYTQAQCDYWYANGMGDAGGGDGGEGCCSDGSDSSAGGTGADSSDSGGDDSGDGGGSVICTELHRQGLLSQEVFDADRRFGVVLRQTDPLVYVGYMVWAPGVVSLMKESVVATKIVGLFAFPWTKEMANISQDIGGGSVFGKVLMSFGMPMCRFLGELKVATNDARAIYFS